MKCKNCGGNYKTRELKCPYCDTENLLGKVWMIERSEAELAYETKKREMGKFLVSPYMLNRVLNRCLIVLAALYVVLFVGAFLVFGVCELYQKISTTIRKEQIEAQMEAYFSAGQYEELDKYMYDNGVDGTAYYAYTQATLIQSDYDWFMEHRLYFDNMSQEEKIADDYHLKYTIKYALEVYSLDYSLYDELDARNTELYETYKKEILAYLVGVLQLTEEEIESVLEDSYITMDEEDMLEQIVRNRRGLK